ncbi:immunoglobulin superfamily member 2 [Sceloporus undulatus]|uniref:immunoglobulin superfamily member 2 n=1 Tax=Sceloporus undulatus TaxID=8520 RepID=UPI001C4AFF28|nr:immunoglobulin superfamily member 2 [Sceloporus undulatus]
MRPLQCLAIGLFLQLDFCAGQRMVSIQKGRLYRARGYHVTIWCNVSGYRGSLQQNFEWSFYKPSAPEIPLQISSTSDESFPYAVYGQRVKSGEIYIERLSGDSVLLHLTDLKDVDAGEYECHTPNTDGIYLGTYSAKMHLSVIPDTLSATMNMQSLSRDQEDSLELTCEVSTATALHTHHSVAWYLLQEGGGGQAQKIISLSREFVLSPGSSYHQRFSSGDVRLDKTGSKKYTLSILSIQPSDQGKIYCEGVEWIQDPDETWKDIARKETNRTSLTVRSLDKRFFVNISVTERSLLEGERLQITCCVEAQNIQYRWFQVAWYRHGMVVASLDQYGSLTFPNDNEQKYSMGNLLVKKDSNSKYILQISQLELKDKGTYSCEVSEIEKTPTGSFAITEQKSSSGMNINVKPRESHMHLSVSVNNEKAMEGSALVFYCNGTITDQSVSVTWWHIQKDREPPLFIASMDQDGKLKIGPCYLERSASGELRLEKLGSSIFTLTIYNSSATKDTGLYRCEVTEWSKGKSWKHTQEISTKVEPLGLDLKAVLSSRIPNVNLHEDFELFCKISVNDTTNPVPVSITWQFKPSSGTAGYQQVVKVTAGGTIEWGSPYLHLQKKAKITKSSSVSWLLIYSATWQDSGMYRCEADLWKRSGRHSAVGATAVVLSNPVEIKVTKPESKLNININSKSLEMSGNEDATVDCKIISMTKRNSLLGITWYFLPLSPEDAIPLMILRTNYSNILEYGEAFSSPRQKSRFHSKKVSSLLYQLLILSADHDVQGKYYCEADEWIWSMEGSWYSLGKMESGKTTVYFKLSENKPCIERTNHSITTTENEDVTLKCILQSTIQPTSRFSVTWFKVSEHFNAETLVEIKSNGIIQYGNVTMARRLQPHCSSVGDFHLTLWNVEMEDAGLFYCQVEEWQAANSSTAQVQHASGQSGYSNLVVLPSDSRSSSQICSSRWLYHFILFCPLVLFLTLTTVFLMLYFRRKHVQKGKMALEQNKTSGEELGVLAPTTSTQ